ncbi:MAG TPA: DUF362 domain-containing protein [Anaerolineaceae bacterium]|jgi:hypothetical protein
MTKPVVYYGSPRQSRLDASETLPAKLDLILERLHLRDRVKGELVVLKMHTGTNIGYSTVHPVFVRKVVQAIKDGGGKPFVADVSWDAEGAEGRGYSAEVLGCPVYPAAGPKDHYFYTHHHPFKGLDDWQVAGLIQDASFLVNFAHAKGHPSCSYGGAFKNLALGCMTGKTRSAMHDTCHYDPYWFGEKCPDKSVCKQIVEACPHGGIVEDREHPGEMHLHFEMCNQCGRCLKVAPEGSLRIDPVNFHAFQEACAISTSISLSTFEPGKATHIVLANQITPVCDCFGFTGMSVMPDVGLFASDDIVAVDRAVIDALAGQPLYTENVPAAIEVIRNDGHPLSWMHGPYKDPYLVTRYGEALGLGVGEYELEDVLPVVAVARSEASYISAN